MAVVAPRPFCFGDAASEEGGVVGEVFSLEAEAFAERLVRGPGVIARTGSINSARLRGLSLKLGCGVEEGSDASAAGELSVGGTFGLASDKAAEVGDGDGVGLGDSSAEMEVGDGVGIADLNFGPVFFFLAGVDFLRGR